MQTKGGLRSCTVCKRRRRLTSFATRGHGKVATRCKDCDRSKARLYYKRKYAEEGIEFTRRKNAQSKCDPAARRREEFEYNRKFREQKGRCAICGQKETKTLAGKIVRLSMDHDHKTGALRKLLCSRCNVGLGNFGDNPNLLVKAAEYLKGFAA